VTEIKGRTFGMHISNEVPKIKRLAVNKLGEGFFAGLSLRRKGFPFLRRIGKFGMRAGNKKTSIEMEVIFLLLTINTLL